MASSKPNQPRTFRFPCREFGKTAIVRRSFQSKWFDSFTWFDYDENKNVVYCHTCRLAESQNKSSKEPAFTIKGFVIGKMQLLP